MRGDRGNEPNFLAQKVAKVVHPASDPDLEELVTRMGQGDREAVATFLTKYGELIRRRVRGKLRASVRRLFDTQDIFSTLGRRLDTHVHQHKFLPRSEDEFWSFVFKIAHNSIAEKARIVEALRDKEGEDSDFANWMLGRICRAESSGPDAEHDGASELAFDALLVPLKSEQDHTIAMLWALGLSHPQIGEHLGVGGDYVRDRWRRIREYLRSTFRERDP